MTESQRSKSHPAGGLADVAHKDLDESPRKMVLKSKPIQLSSAVLDIGSSTQADGAYAPQNLQGKDEPSVKVLNLTANSRFSGDGSLPASRRYDALFQRYYVQVQAASNRNELKPYEAN